MSSAAVPRLFKLRKKCLFLFFLSVVTNHLIECTMNELKMDVTVHLITSAYDTGNKSTARADNNSRNFVFDSVCGRRFFKHVWSVMLL